jgi:hypothetical protein
MGRSHLHDSRIINSINLPSCSCALPVNLDRPSSGLSSRQINSIGMEPVELKDGELLIRCPNVPGFSFGDKLWVEILSFQQ